MQGRRLLSRTRYGVDNNATGWSSEFFYVSQSTLDSCAQCRTPGAPPVRVGWIGDMAAVSHSSGGGACWQS